VKFTGTDTEKCVVMDVILLRPNYVKGLSVSSSRQQAMTRRKEEFFPREWTNDIPEEGTVRALFE
jgi:hypothetical protein